MFEAINTINSTISIFDSAIIDIKSSLEENKYEDLFGEDNEMDPLYEELIDKYKPHKILSSLEAIYWSSLTMGSTALVEEIYIQRIEFAFLYIISDILVSRKLVDCILTANNETLSGDECLKRISDYLECMWDLVDEIFQNISIFYSEILEKEVDFVSINDVLKKKITYQGIYEVIRFTDDKKNGGLTSNELEFIKNLTKFGEEEEIFNASEIQLRQLALRKKLSLHTSRKIKFINKHCRADAFRLAKVFNLSLKQANAAFDLGDNELYKHNNPKNSINTPFDEFFKIQYKKYFKDTNSQFFSFTYCILKN
ncbi:MAG: hypothetical protein JEZ14_24720 [Marinilabiliaceae bacterium]|nr:hypothetical protein [Marinilabiliaceae bacterium]